MNNRWKKKPFCTPQFHGQVEFGKHINFIVLIIGACVVIILTRTYIII